MKKISILTVTIAAMTVSAVASAQVTPDVDSAAQSAVIGSANCAVMLGGDGFVNDSVPAEYAKAVAEAVSAGASDVRSLAAACASGVQTPDQSDEGGE